MLLARRPEKLKPDQAQLLAKLNECCPEIPILYDLTQGFAQVFRDKQSEHLQTWIDHARGTGLLEIGHFCDGLRRDEKAVNAAVYPALEQRPGRGPNSSTKTGQTANVRPGQIQPLASSRSALCRRRRHRRSTGRPLTCTESAGEPLLHWR